MKIRCFIIAILVVLLGSSTPIFAKGKSGNSGGDSASKGPDHSRGPGTGAATPADVLLGVTFSSSTENGQVGARPAAPVAATGATLCYDTAGLEIACLGTGQDAELRNGEALTGRFELNGNGTVIDKLTGLVWLQDANCYGSESWDSGVSLAASLADGECGLADGSAPGDWRVPNIRELLSLVNFGYYDYSLGNTDESGQWVEDGEPWIDVKKSYYWTTTPERNPKYPEKMSRISLKTGRISSTGTTKSGYLMFVREIKDGE